MHAIVIAIFNSIKCTNPAMAFRNFRNFFRSFNNIMSVLGTARDEMLAVHLDKTYCLPVLLCGSETWSLSSSDKYRSNVAWNNWFHGIFNGFWKESVQPLLFYCNTSPLMSVADQWRLTFLRNITCSRPTNPILSTLGRLCDYDTDHWQLSTI